MSSDPGRVPWREGFDGEPDRSGERGHGLRGGSGRRSSRPPRSTCWSSSCSRSTSSWRSRSAGSTRSCGSRCRPGTRSRGTPTCCRSRSRTSRTPTACTTARSCTPSCSSAIATFLCLVIGYPFAYFLARQAGRWRGLFLVAVLRAVLDLVHAPDAGLDLAAAGRRVREPDPGEARAHPASRIRGCRASRSTLIIGLVYGYVPFMVLPLFATLDRIHAVAAGGGARPRREPRDGRSGASRCPCRRQGDPGRVRDLRPADVRRLLHAAAAGEHGQHADDRQRDRRRADRSPSSSPAAPR